MLTAIFAVADEINVKGDKAGAFSLGDNHLRIHWLLRRLTFERCSLDERTAILVNACMRAQLGWLVDFTTSAIDDYFPREGKEAEPPENCLVAEGVLDSLRARALEALGKAATDGSLIEHPDLPYLLYRWRDLAKDDGAAVKTWVSTQLPNDKSVALLANAFTGESWSQGMGMFGLGDRVATRNVRASVGSLNTILDPEAFRMRLEEIEQAKTLDEPYLGYVLMLLDAWRRKDRGEDGSW